MTSTAVISIAAIASATAARQTRRRSGRLQVGMIIETGQVFATDSVRGQDISNTSRTAIPLRGLTWRAASLDRAGVPPFEVGQMQKVLAQHAEDTDPDNATHGVEGHH